MLRDLTKNTNLIMARLGIEEPPAIQKEPTSKQEAQLEMQGGPPHPSIVSAGPSMIKKATENERFVLYVLFAN